MKTVITFGQCHKHIIGSDILDHDCVAVFDCDDYNHGRELAFKLFGRKFCTTYLDSEFNLDQMERYPRGMIDVTAASLIL